MITYELAKKLKDAGFPQGTGKDGEHHECPHKEFYQDSAILILHGTECNDWVYFPILSELIEACGDEFLKLVKSYKYGWEAVQVLNPKKKRIRGIGNSPEEAVANLWLELSKK